MFDVTSPLTCATALRINLKNPYLKAYQNTGSQSIAIISGHLNGAVYLWEDFATVEEVILLS